MSDSVADALLSIRVLPRAPHDEIAGERDGALLVRVMAPPSGGEANEAVRKLLAKRARVAKGRVEIVRGESARDKLVRVEGFTAAELRRRLLRAYPDRSQHA